MDRLAFVRAKEYIRPLPPGRLARLGFELLLVQGAVLLLFTFQYQKPISWLGAQFFTLYCLCTVLWCSWRWRIRPGSRTGWQQVLLSVMLMGVVVSELLPSIILSSLLLGGQATFTFLRPVGSIFLAWPHYLELLGWCCLFLLLRAGTYLWRFWHRLRRTRLLWALTHAHLLVVIIGASILSVLIVGIDLLFANMRLHLVEFLLVALFATCIVILFVLPGAALFSYFFSRRLTRRIEHLTLATSALRNANYGVRVIVEGRDEIAHLQTDFNAMAAELARTMRELQQERDTVAALLQARRELIASVSHELRTPVATVRSYLESTLSAWDEQPPATLCQDLQVMQQQTIRLQLLINDLFTLARAEVGRLEMRSVPTDVRLPARRVAETMAPLAWRGSKVEVVTDIQPRNGKIPHIRLDEQRLEQVLQNLLHNAVRHTPPGGIIVVSVRVNERMLLLQVKDTGEGIPSEELPLIWERFYRTENGRAKAGSGTGLGLAIVKELTEMMGGTVAVESTPGKGTCFTLCFPLANCVQSVFIPGQYTSIEQLDVRN